MDGKNEWKKQPSSLVNGNCITHATTPPVPSPGGRGACRGNSRVTKPVKRPSSQRREARVFSR